MEKINYSELLTNPLWQKKRLEIMNRDAFTCQKCNHTDTTLNVHHLKYHNGLKPWEYLDVDLITLCKDCHFEIEELKKAGDKTPFKDIVIYKINMEDNPIRVLFILHGYKCSLKKYYGDRLDVHLPFTGKKMNEVISKMFKKASEWVPLKKEYANDDSIFNMGRYKESWPF